MRSFVQTNLNGTSLYSSVPEQRRTVQQRTSGRYLRNQDSDCFRYLYDVLQQIQAHPSNKQKFIDECRLFYRDNPSVLAAIDEFETTYERTRAVWWYTREGFIYRRLNQALRERDQECMLLLHFFIYDISQQIKNEHKRNSEASWRAQPIYRGQLMDSNEIKLLIQLREQRIYVSTYLSTTSDRAVAHMFSGAGNYTKDAPQQPVLFQIDGECFLPTEKPVADITHLSANQDEREIIFCPTYTFALREVVYNDEEQVWRVALQMNGALFDQQVEFEQRLIRLDVMLRTLAEEKGTSATTDALTTFRQFVENVKLLVQEVSVLPSVSCVSLNTVKNQALATTHTVYELKALQNLSVNENLNMLAITPTQIMALHDCLADALKQNGKYQLAMEHYTFANCYGPDESDETADSREALNRTVSSTQNVLLFHKQHCCFRSVTHSCSQREYF